MKTLLLISSRFPYPPIGGDKLKNYHLIKILSKHYKIHFVCICNQKPTPEMIDFCETHFAKYKLFTKTKIQHLIALSKSLFNSLPLQVNYYTFKDIKRYINYEIQDVDFAINTLVRTSEYLIDKHTIKFLDIVDSIALNYSRSQNKTQSFFWKKLYAFESKRLLTYEKHCIANYNASFFVNHDEAKFFKPYGKVEWIPNGVDSELLNHKTKLPQYRKFLAFCGKMDYQPNIDAILWFCKNVFPSLDSQINLVIIGSNPSAKIKKLQSSRIHITGFVKDPHIINASTFATIAPMQTGGGIQNKILEALALGQIVISSPLGAKPIVGAKNAENIYIYHSAQEMIEIIHHIFYHPDNHAHIQKNAQKLIASRYLWNNYETKLIDLIQSTQPTH